MTFVEKLIENIQTCYLYDPGFFWGTIIFLVIVISGLYLTILLYRKHIGSTYYFKWLAIIMFFGMVLLLTVPIMGLIALFDMLGLESQPADTWCYIPLPIFTAYILRKKFLFKTPCDNHSLPDSFGAPCIEKDRYVKQPTKLGYGLLVFVAVFLVASGLFIFDAFFHFLGAELQKYVALSLGIIFICGTIVAVITQALQIVRFSKKRFTKH